MWIQPDTAKPSELSMYLRLNDEKTQDDFIISYFRVLSECSPGKTSTGSLENKEDVFMVLALPGHLALERKGRCDTHSC